MKNHKTETNPIANHSRNYLISGCIKAHIFLFQHIIVYYVSIYDIFALVYICFFHMWVKFKQPLFLVVVF